MVSRTHADQRPCGSCGAPGGVSEQGGNGAACGVACEREGKQVCGSREMSILSEQRSFVLFPMGKKRFALPAEQVSELARPGNQAKEELQSLRHSTPLLSRLILRRKQIVPVANVVPLLVGPEAPEGKFYLIVQRQIASTEMRLAVPITGECELAEATQRP